MILNSKQIDAYKKAELSWEKLGDHGLDVEL